MLYGVFGFHAAEPSGIHIQDAAGSEQLSGEPQFTLWQHRLDFPEHERRESKRYAKQRCRMFSH
jgi:hypothetical protein